MQPITAKTGQRPGGAANRRRLALGALASLLLAASAAAPPGRTEPAVQLVETVPVETALGHPDLPRAAGVWVEMIRGARRTIDFESFYLSHWPGEALGPVLDAIGASAKRGVRIRILLDSRMHRTYPQPADSLGTLPGIEVRTIDLGRIAGGVQHSKFFVVDGEAAYLGSQNLDWRALSHIHELGVKIRDARAAGYFARVFEMDWAAAGAMAAGDSASAREAGLAAARSGAGEPKWPLAIAQGPGDTLRLWASASPHGFIPGSRWDRDAIEGLIDRARSEVVVQALSYGTRSRGESDSTLDAALRRAAARGVRVRLMMSDWQADSRRIEDLAALGAVPNIEARLIVVPEWSGGYIPFARVDHTKYMVVDSLHTWVGTSNWSPDYFWSSRNVAVVLEHRGIAAQARRIFETGWRSPGTLEVKPGRDFTPRPHGEDPPPGKTKHGG